MCFSLPQQAEQDKATKDHQIRNLNDEIAHQDELINKLNKEKKQQGETNQKTSEELQVTPHKYYTKNLVSSVQNSVVTVGALYGNLILHILPSSVHRAVVNDLKCNIILKSFFLGRSWDLKPSVIEGLR
jgi:uncharacterized protein (DUF3084 family)